MLMTRNEEMRQGVPIREVQPTRETHTSTPESTLTNSQYSQSQEQPMSTNKRRLVQPNVATTALSTVVKPVHPDDETTALSTVGNDTTEETDDGEYDNMVEDQMEPINNEQIYDVTMEDNEQTTAETIQTAMVAGNFSQFKKSPQNNNNNKETKPNDTSAKTDMNQDNE